MISCLMVTQPGREAFAARAAADFRAQSCPDKELVVVVDPRDGTPLGELRNVALARARGDVVAIWDDDDRSARGRLAAQRGAMASAKAAVGFLSHVSLLCVCGAQVRSS